MDMQSPPTVLIVVDDPLLRLQVSEGIKADGFKTLEASSIESGLALYTLHDADAVIIDNTPTNGINGFMACIALGNIADGHSPPVMLMLDREDTDAVSGLFEAGAADFLIKPVDIPILCHRIRHMLRVSLHNSNRVLANERQIFRLANHDGLTDLPNRQFFREHLERMVTLGGRKKLKLAVLSMDLDGFKHINESLGHDFGDRVIQATGERLQKSLRVSDMMVRSEYLQDEENFSLARLGGDEFTVLLSTIEHDEDAAIVADRIIANIARPILIDDHELYTTTSIGIALFPVDGETGNELLKSADMAMYSAKSKGGNIYQYFTAKMNEVALRRHSLESQLRKAIEHGELEVHYQPLYDFELGRFTGMEALLRWDNPILGEVLPAEFIPLAEETGLIISIGTWAIRQACMQAASWVNDHKPLNRMAVNVSAVQVLHKDFPTLIASILTESGLDPTLLELELTESAIISDEDTVFEALLILKEIGVKLAIDDFGIGYSSLARLKKFPIDRLKIDKSFVGDIGVESGSGEIALAVIALAEGMDMKVTAEGVETNDQLNFLKKRRCHEVQGFLLSKPLNSTQAQKFLNLEVE
jgi:diguanylate cyclase